MNAPEPPTLDRTTESWTGNFPGLGTVRIAADGTVDVVVDDTDDEDVALKEQALRWGWGEALSFVRRGFQTAGGAAACPPGEAADALILPGDPHDVAIVLAALVQRGWSVLGDRFTPVAWEGSSLVAQPRQAPLIMAQRRLTKLGLEGEQVRGDSDARIVTLPRVAEPRTVAGIAEVSMRRPHEEALTALKGQKRFEAAAQLMMGGALRPAGDVTAEEAPAGTTASVTPGVESDAAPSGRGTEVIAARTAEVVAEHLRLAAIPSCHLCLDHAVIDEDVEALLRWWDKVTVNRGAA